MSGEKRLTGREAALRMDIFKSNTTAAGVAHQYGLTVSEVESWIDEAQLSMKNSFKARPMDIHEHLTSGEYSFDVVMTQSFQGIESSGIPGRFSLAC